MSHQLVVSDWSVLVDLERGTLGAAAFALPIEFGVPDLVYRRELEPLGGGRLVALGLRVLELDNAGVARAVRYHRAVPALSLSDAFALALAHATGSALLTGNARLRRLASDDKVVCHDVPWLLDRMFQEGFCDAETTVRWLGQDLKPSRYRLPKAEVSKRLHIFERTGKSA